MFDLFDLKYSFANTLGIILGTLIKETGYEWEKMRCARTSSIVNIPSLFDTFEKAEEACNKIAVGSMTGLFKVFLSLTIS